MCAIHAEYIIVTLLNTAVNIWEVWFFFTVVIFHRPQTCSEVDASGCRWSSLTPGLFLLRSGAVLYMHKLRYRLAGVIVIPWRKHHPFLSVHRSQLCNQCKKKGVRLAADVNHNAAFMNTCRLLSGYSQLANN